MFDEVFDMKSVRCCNCGKIVRGDVIMDDWPAPICDRCAAAMEDEPPTSLGDDLPSDVGIDEWLKRKEYNK